MQNYTISLTQMVQFKSLTTNLLCDASKYERYDYALVSGLLYPKFGESSLSVEDSTSQRATNSQGPAEAKEVKRPTFIVIGSLPVSFVAEVVLELLNCLGIDRTDSMRQTCSLCSA